MMNVDSFRRSQDKTRILLSQEVHGREWRRRLMCLHRHTLWLGTAVGDGRRASGSKPRFEIMLVQWKGQKKTERPS